MNEISNMSHELSADHRDFYSTNLNHRISTIADLTKRIAYSLGWPQVNIETHAAQVYDNIAIACEMFTKYAGYSEEYLIFNSKLYEPGKGIRLDKLMTVTPEMDGLIEWPKEETDGMAVGNMSGVFQPPFTIGKKSNEEQNLVEAPASFDTLTLNYRRVVDVFTFEEGTTSGVNTLFTIEQTLAQQTYFSYAMGKYGFDLVSWYTLKEWLDVRKKLLSQFWHTRFNDRTQRLYVMPEPSGPNRADFWGLIGCYVEKPLAHLLKEPFIYKYALALTKIVLGRIRGKYANTALFGGGVVNYQELLAEGIAERDTLEEQLYTGAAGMGDAEPPKFFVG
jgi:hypothetical protein